MKSSAAIGQLRELGSRRPLLLLGTSAVAFSTAPVFVQASSTSGPVFAFWRSWIGIMAICAGVTLAGRIRIAFPRGREWRLPFWAGFFNAVSMVTFMTAVKFTAVADISLLTMLNPVLIALWAIPMFGERPGLRFRLWTLVAILGSGVVILGGSTGPDGDPLGIAMGTTSVLCWSFQYVTTKRARATMDTIPLMVGMLVVSTLFISLFCFATRAAVWNLSGADMLHVVGVVVVPGGMGAMLLSWSLRWVPANVPPLMYLPAPFLAAAMAWLFLGEGVTLVHVGGGAMTLAGVAAALLSRSGKALLATEYTRPTASPPPV
ncbi:MAG: DMT family transporter [Acidimicrobiia bacterium]|nr:DMT family transporter [Acidimicrobiia bacterium]